VATFSGNMSGEVTYH